MSVSSTPIIPQTGLLSIWEKQLGKEHLEKQKNLGGLQGCSVNVKELILSKILSYIQAICFYKNIGLNIKTAICFKLQISKSIGLQELILTVPKHSEGGTYWQDLAN